MSGARSQEKKTGRIQTAEDRNHPGGMGLMEFYLALGALVVKKSGSEKVIEIYRSADHILISPRREDAKGLIKISFEIGQY